MSDQQHFELLIIASGEAGKNLARTMSKPGLHTADAGGRITAISFE
jgi:pyruvate/2-oxoglutarate dehydrogenase complex dihydrolipoamide dehydrogenase (E3) component